MVLLRRGRLQPVQRAFNAMSVRYRSTSFARRGEKDVSMSESFESCLIEHDFSK